MPQSHFSALEPRLLLSATLNSAIAPIIVTPTPAPATINLASHFSDPALTGTAVLLQTPQGNIPLALTDSATPATVANFLQYINSGEFADAIIHRSIPGFVIQGGGYLPDGNPINTFGTINSEAGEPNVADTIAMALITGPDSATSQWFINLADNSQYLDNSSDGGPYTVFGNVIYNGMSVVNAIANLPVIDASEENTAWTNLPVINYTGPNPITAPVPAGDLVTVDAEVVPALGYSVSSSNSALVNPTLSGSNLTLTYGSGTGSATIAVTATDLGGGTATSTFAVDVGEPSVTVGSGGAKAVRFTEPGGSTAQISLVGPGSVSLVGPGLTERSGASGVVTVTGAAASDILTATGTTPASTLTVAGKSVDLAGLTASGSFKAIDAPTTTLADDTTIAGSVGSLALASASGAISAGSIGKLTVKGALAASLSASSVGVTTADSLGGAWAITGPAGSISATSSSSFSANLGSLAKLTVKGSISNAIIRTAGAIGRIAVGGMADADFYAGIASIVPAGDLPNYADISASSPPAIDSVKIGKSGFVGSILAAADLGNLSLGFVTLNNDGTPFGLAAGRIADITAAVSLSTKLSLRDITTESQVTAALSAKHITPGDFEIAII